MCKHSHIFNHYQLLFSKFYTAMTHSTALLLLGDLVVLSMLSNGQSCGVRLRTHLPLFYLIYLPTLAQVKLNLLPDSPIVIHIEAVVQTVVVVESVLILVLQALPVQQNFV